jgi:hypothetical protein
MRDPVAGALDIFPSAFDNRMDGARKTPTDIILLCRRFRSSPGSSG